MYKGLLDVFSACLMNCGRHLQELTAPFMYSGSREGCGAKSSDA